MYKDKQNKFELEQSNAQVIENMDFDKLINTLPASPDKSTVKRLLIELPSRLLSLQTEYVDRKRDIGDLKVVLKTKKTLLEREKSESRKRNMDAYNNKRLEFKNKSQEVMEKIMNSSDNASLKKAYLQELIGVLKPEKPTKSELDDNADIETYYLQEEINELEEKINEASMDLEVLSTKIDFFDNMFVTIRAYKGILVEEMRNG